MEGIFVPIGFFAVTGIIVWLVVWFRFRSRSEMQQTVRLALEKGAELSPELLDKLSGPAPREDKDLRNGLIWIAIAVGTALCGLALQSISNYVLLGCLAGAALPLAIGIAYLVMWKFASGKDSR